MTLPGPRPPGDGADPTGARASAGTAGSTGAGGAGGPAGGARVLVPSDPRAMADLAVFVARARRADPGGAVRLSVVRLPGGEVLTATVAPLGDLRGPGLPVVLGLRALALAPGPGTDVEAALDTTVALADVESRLVRDPTALPVPPAQVHGAAWAGLAPPRSGWAPAGEVSIALLVQAATGRAARVAAGEPRERVWAEGITATGLPAALALVADVLGFLARDGAATVARAGAWTRLSTPTGHVLSRSPLI